MAAMHCGMFTTFPLDTYNNFLDTLNPDMHSATSVFAYVVSMLNYLFTQLSDEGDWKQCFCCLNFPTPPPPMNSRRQPSSPAIKTLMLLR